MSWDERQAVELTIDELSGKPFARRPNWLDQEALPRRLLERFLTKLEKGQRLSLRITPKTAPELFDFRFEDVKFLWELVKSLDKEFHVLNVKLQRNKPNQEIYENALVYFNPEKEKLVRHWLNRPALDPYALVWEAELARMKEQFEDYGQALFENIVRVPEHGPEETLRAFARIGKQLRHPVTLRALSARCFWGDSKFLDRSEHLIQQLYPSLSHNLLPRPVLMSVHLPAVVEQVLFIENQDTFIALAERNLPGLACVYSAGFHASGHRVRARGSVLFSYLNPGVSAETVAVFENWWFGVPDTSQPPIRAWFWGDLDFAGMAVLQALRETFTKVEAWPPGYQPLLERLVADWGHSHDFSGKGLQRDPELTGSEWADLELLPAIREQGRFIDQEAISIDEVLAVLEGKQT